jgi:hypothetical protein
VRHTAAATSAWPSRALHTVCARLVVSQRNTKTAVASSSDAQVLVSILHHESFRLMKSWLNNVAGYLPKPHGLQALMRWNQQTYALQT